MTKTAADLSENPDSTADLVRDLEESGYPVDGAKEQFIPLPNDLAVKSDRPDLPPAQPGGAHKISITSIEKS